MLHKDRLRKRHFEVTYVLGRFFTEHLIRVYKAFDGDLTAAIVLGTIGQYNYRRYYDEIGKDAPEGWQSLIARGAHLDYARPCNAMSVSQSTGIPRETVRRKIRQLIARGWLRREGPDELFVTSEPSRHFAEFDLDTLEYFYDAAQKIVELVERESRC
jgi:hypothetical protein